MREIDRAVDSPSTTGRHRRAYPYSARHRGYDDHGSGPVRATTAALLVTIGIGALAFTGGSVPGSDPPKLPSADTIAAIEARERSQQAARSLARSSPTPTPATVAPKATTPVAPAKPAPRTTAPKKPTTPKPVAPKTTTPKTTTPRKTTAATAKAPTPVGGLSQGQMNHAATIVRTGQQLGLPQRAYLVAISTTLQESYLRNLANETYPESLNLPHDGVGADHDSVGLFQQRPSAGWGTVAQCMDPVYAARKFYQALQEVWGWQDMSLAEAAQAVQVSAFPDAYAKHEPLATQIVNALT